MSAAEVPTEGRGAGAPLDPPTSAYAGRLAVLASAFLIVVVGLAAYSNGLDTPFHFDDEPNLITNGDLDDWRTAVFSTFQSGLAGRPIPALSFHLDRRLHGFEVRGYHLVNVGAHLLAALLLFGVVRRTLASLDPARWGRGATGVALFAALVWVAHPMTTGAVTYIVQRIEVLMSLFLLATLYAALRSFTSERAWPWALLSVLACALGMASKEVMVGAPLLVLLWDVKLGAGSPNRSIGRALGDRKLYYLALAATWGVLAWGVIQAGGRSESVGSGLLRVTTVDYLKVQATAVLSYARLALWPHPLVFDHGMRIVPTTLQWLGSGALVLALLAGTALALFKEGPVARGLSLAGAWFFVLLAPTSSFLPIVTEPIVEHRAYLAIAAVTTLAAVLGARVLERALAAPGPRRLVGAVLVVGLSLALVLATRARNRDYATPLGLWSDAVAKRPDNDRAHVWVGNLLRAQGRGQEALAHYREAVRLFPDYPDWRNAFGTGLTELGLYDRATTQYQAGLQLEPTSVVLLTNLGINHSLAGRPELAVQAYGAALMSDPYALDAHQGRAVSLMALGRRAEALPHLRAVLNARPGDADMLLRLAWLRATAPEPELANPAEALALVRSVIGLVGERAEVLEVLAAAQAAGGEFEAAAASSRRVEALERAAGRNGPADVAAQRARLYASGRALTDGGGH